ncbi:tetratricopeptide repeat protein [Pleurocapsa sp. PCC 7327]|nr:tetratricopeptide repeat protein [Pleurocapsa sp. PCC 7327]
MVRKIELTDNRMSDRTYFSRILNSIVAVAIIFLETAVIQEYKAIAQSEQTNRPDPLEQPIEDSLLPSRRRSLTPFEVRRLREALDALNAEAQVQLQAGDANKAFEIWYRELRLRRTLGRLEEIDALGRVGQIAWEQERSQDVQIITKHLNVVQQEAESEASLSPELLKAFATAYQQVHNINNSIEIYQKILDNARQEKDTSAEEEALKKLGELYLAKFDYPNAAKIYEELLKRSQSRSNSYNEGIYLQKLAKIYSQALRPKNAVRIKEQLAENYQNNQITLALAELKLEIGADYETLKQPEKASQNYQEAFSLAWSQQEYGTAGDALIKLGNLYQAYNQDDYALQIYQELIKVEQQSYNYYGLMQTYDRIGQIYLKQKNYPQALTAFQQGLEIARSLKYREDYFLSQIKQINSQKIP